MVSMKESSRRGTLEYAVTLAFEKQLPGTFTNKKLVKYINYYNSNLIEKNPEAKVKTEGHFISYAKAKIFFNELKIPFKRNRLQRFFDIFRTGKFFEIIQYVGNILICRSVTVVKDRREVVTKEYSRECIKCGFLVGETDIICENCSSNLSSNGSTKKTHSIFPELRI